MKRDAQAQAPRVAGEPFARRRSRLEEAEESELGREIRAREEEPEADEEAAEPSLPELLGES